MSSGPAAFGTFPVTRAQQCLSSIGRRLPRNRVGKRVSGWLRALAQGTATGPVDMVVLGVRMRLYLNNNACERRLLVTPHFFDPHDLEILASHIGADFSFIDLGANVGLYSLFVARWAGAGAKILAVEPHPIAVQRLRDNIALNDFNISVAPTAVAERDGVLELAVDSNNIGATTVRSGRRVRGRREQITVPACTLHQLVDEHGFRRIDALKVDIEGAEGHALSPFLATAPPNLWPRLILLELHIAPAQCRLLSELESLGWRPISNRRTDNCVLQRM